MTQAESIGEDAETARALADSEARSCALVEATAQFVSSRGPHGESSALTDAWWEQLTGQMPDEVGDREGYAWLNSVHADDCNRAFEAWSDAFSRRRLFDVEYRVRARDGSYRHYSVRDAAGSEAALPPKTPPGVRAPRASSARSR